VNSDYREPLPTAWIIPYYGAGAAVTTYIRGVIAMVNSLGGGSDGMEEKKAYL
jgi:hypothetical protein